MALATVFIHLVGLGILTRLLRSHSMLLRKVRIMPLTLLLAATMASSLIHTSRYGCMQRSTSGSVRSLISKKPFIIRPLPTRPSVYGDVLIARNWRILGAIEGAVGILMLGWSTAYLVSLLSQTKLIDHDWLKVEKRR